MHAWLRDDIPCGHGPEGNRRGACIAFYGGPPLRLCACGSPPALLTEAVEDRDDPSPLVEEDDDVDDEMVDDNNYSEGDEDINDDVSDDKENDKY